jgi:hypothetical protein
MHSFLAIQRRLEELESLMAQPPRASPLSQHANDLSPTDVRALNDQFAQIRAVMLSHLQELGIPLDIRRTSVRWVLQTSLMQLQLEIEELGPDRLRRYGPLEDPDRTAALRIQSELRRLLDRSRAYLGEGCYHGTSENRSLDESSSSNVKGESRP